MSFSPAYLGIPVNHSEISQKILNIENKYRSNPLTWNGQFSPQFVEAILQKYATSQSVLFDPFVGSGTVLLEGGRRKLKTYGAEINPAAIALSQTYLFINVANRKEILAKVDRGLKTLVPDLALNQHAQDSEYIKAQLLTLLFSRTDRLEYQLLETLITLLEFGENILTSLKLFRVWDNLQKHILNLPYSDVPITVFHTDARKTPLANASIDLILTSPPYINVFNYHQQYRASVETLRWNLLEIAKSEIGANRKHRGNRFLTVIQFCLDIAQVFKEIARICQPDARVIFVVGRESKVRNISFYNGQIVTEVAVKSLGFNLILRQERVFLNRFGSRIYEDILHFSLPRELINENYLYTARLVGIQALLTAPEEASQQVQQDIEDAINRASRVEASPLFEITGVTPSAGQESL